MVSGQKHPALQVDIREEQKQTRTGKLFFIKEKTAKSNCYLIYSLKGQSYQFTLFNFLNFCWHTYALLCIYSVWMKAKGWFSFLYCKSGENNVDNNDN